MAEKLSRIGIESTAIIGNIEKTGETYLESNHIWLIVKIAGQKVAIDRACICLDRQHYEGYTLTRGQLLHFIQQDKKQYAELSALLE
jgi:hypothetical protein